MLPSRTIPPIGPLLCAPTVADTGGRQAGTNGRVREREEKHVREFYVVEDDCTECGDCIKALPQAFRQVEDEEVAEVYNTDIDEALEPKVQKIIDDCPGKAIKWR